MPLLPAIVLCLVSLLWGSLLLPTLAQAATYYVANGGTDHSCSAAQSPSTRRSSIANGIACLSGGDTLLVGNGTYVESIQNTIPSGSSGAPTVVKAENKYGAVIRPGNLGSGTQAVDISGSYITFDGFTVDATNLTNVVIYLSGSAHHNIVQNCDIFGMAHIPNDGLGAAGINIYTDTSFNTVRNNKVHDLPNSCDLAGLCCHGIYTHGSDNIIEGNEIYNNKGYGIQQYQNPGSGPGSARNIVRNNRVYDNYQTGILLGTGDNNVSYNNIVYGNGFGANSGGGRHGISINNGGGNNQVYNNTIYNNNGYGVRVGGVADSIITNNITYQNTDGGVENPGNGTGTVCCGGSCPGSCNFSGNPSFVNASDGDFHLQSGSGAATVGLNLSSLFTKDYADGVRPATGAWSAGAYQFGAGSALPSPTNLRLLSITNP